MYPKSLDLDQKFIQLTLSLFVFYFILWEISKNVKRRINTHFWSLTFLVTILPYFFLIPHTHFTPNILACIFLKKYFFVHNHTTIITPHNCHDFLVTFPAQYLLTFPQLNVFIADCASWAPTKVTWGFKHRMYLL